MNKGRNPVQKTGNNTLIFIAGILLIVLLGLIYIGSLRESSVDQLIEAAAPDSSSFANDSMLSQPIAEEQAEPETEPIIEKPKEVKDTSAKVDNPIELPADSTTKEIEKTSPVQNIKIETNGNEKTYLYKIKKGDTMYKIAARFGNKPADILIMNGLSDMSVQADKEVKVKVKNLHVVADGEGLNSISERYSVPAKSIQIANGLTSDVLSAGAQLIIPLK